MFKSLAEVRNHKKSIESKGLFTSVIYFLSPITGEVEERHIYADDKAEALSWLNHCHLLYKERKIKYCAYYCGVITYGYLNPFEDLI